jgi:Nickel-dependent hydrogenase
MVGVGPVRCDLAMLGGKTPHIQNVAVGGVASAINLESEAALNVDRLFQMKSLVEKIISFVQNVYVPDVCAIAGLCPDWFSYGASVTNYLSVPDLPLDGKSTSSSSPAASFPTAISRSSSPSPARRTRPGAVPSPKTAPTPGTKAATRCIRGKARPTPSPPSGTKRRNTPGSKPRATTASPRRSARSPMQSSADAQARRLRPAHEKVDRRRAREDLRHRPRQRHPGHAPLHPRPPRRPRHPRRRPLRAGHEAMAAPHRQHPQRRHHDLQQARVPEGHHRRRRLPRSPPRRALPLRRRRRRHHQELPGRRPHHLERQPPRHQRHPRPIRVVPPGQPRRRRRAPPRSPAHHPLVRSLYGLRSPHVRPLRPEHR